MLVLSRRESERIRLGDSIVVTVVKIAGDKVRIGIEAPADVLVLRDELQKHPLEAASHEPPLAQADSACLVDQPEEHPGGQVTRGNEVQPSPLHADLALAQERLPKSA